MTFATPRNRNCRAFTLAEVLAAMLFIAIVIPAAVEAMHLASLAGEVAARIRTLGYEPVWKDWDAALTM